LVRVLRADGRLVTSVSHSSPLIAVVELMTGAATVVGNGQGLLLVSDLESQALRLRIQVESRVTSLCLVDPHSVVVGTGLGVSLERISISKSGLLWPPGSVLS
jgi:hypothetical protein